MANPQMIDPRRLVSQSANYFAVARRALGPAGHSQPRKRHSNTNQQQHHNMQITLTHAGLERMVDIPAGSPAGIVRRLNEDLEEIGVPGNYSLSVNGEAAHDDTPLSPGARIGFRPIAGEKGA